MYFIFSNTARKTFELNYTILPINQDHFGTLRSSTHKHVTPFQEDEAIRTRCYDICHMPYGTYIYATSDICNAWTHGWYLEMKQLEHVLSWG